MPRLSVAWPIKREHHLPLRLSSTLTSTLLVLGGWASWRASREETADTRVRGWGGGLSTESGNRQTVTEMDKENEGGHACWMVGESCE